MRIVKKILSYFNSDKLLNLENFGLLLVLISSCFLIFTGICIIFGLYQTIEIFKATKIDHIRILVGILEIMISILIILPRTSLIGIFLLGIIMGGAISFHLSHLQGRGMEAPIIILLTATIGYLIRNLKTYKLT